LGSTDIQPTVPARIVFIPVRELNIPGSSCRFGARVDTIVEHLEQVGEARTDELKPLVDVNAVTYSFVGPFWANAVRTKRALKYLLNIEAAGKSKKVYGFNDSAKT